ELQNSFQISVSFQQQRQPAAREGGVTACRSRRYQGKKIGPCYSSLFRGVTCSRRSADRWSAVSQVADLHRVEYSRALASPRRADWAVGDTADQRSALRQPAGPGTAPFPFFGRFAHAGFYWIHSDVTANTCFFLVIADPMVEGLFLPERAA